MTTKHLIVAGLIALSSLVTIGTIGKPKSPTEPPIAVAIVVVNALMIWLILS